MICTVGNTLSLEPVRTRIPTTIGMEQLGFMTRRGLRKSSLKHVTKWNTILKAQATVLNETALFFQVLETTIQMKRDMLGTACHSER